MGREAEVSHKVMEFLIGDKAWRMVEMGQGKAGHKVMEVGEMARDKGCVAKGRVLEHIL